MDLSLLRGGISTGVETIKLTSKGSTIALLNSSGETSNGCELTYSSGVVSGAPFLLEPHQSMCTYDLGVDGISIIVGIVGGVGKGDDLCSLGCLGGLSIGVSAQCGGGSGQETDDGGGIGGIFGIHDRVEFAQLKLDKEIGVGGLGSQVKEVWLDDGGVVGGGLTNTGDISQEYIELGKGGEPIG